MIPMKARTGLSCKVVHSFGELIFFFPRFNRGPARTSAALCRCLFFEAGTNLRHCS